MELTLNERFDWLKKNKPENYKVEFFSWEDNVELNIKADMYSYIFNHPYYWGDNEKTSDELRHELLDDLNVPRFIK